MKLKKKDGQIEYRFEAGKDMVSARMDAELAEKIVNSNEHEVQGNEVIVGKFHFPILVEGGKKTKNKG